MLTENSFSLGVDLENFSVEDLEEFKNILYINYIRKIVTGSQDYDDLSTQEMRRYNLYDQVSKHLTYREVKERLERDNIQLGERFKRLYLRHRFIN